MQIKIRTLTPIWTGGIDGKCTKLRETSIIGSLRWWFEAIVRGLGGYACDPTSDKRCPENNKYCAVCFVFGATERSKLFRLVIDETGTHKVNMAPIVKAREDNSHKGWYLGKEDSGGILGEFIIDIHEIYGTCSDLIALLLHTSSLWGIGAKTQDGFGICNFEGNYNLDSAINRIREIISTATLNKSDSKVLPNLEDFFFAKIRIKDDVENKIKSVFDRKLYKKEHQQISISEFLKIISEDYGERFYPTAPLIRDWLRGLFRDGNDDLRHFLFGFVAKNIHKSCGGVIIKGSKCVKCGKKVNKNEIERKPILMFNNTKFEKMASKIFVSHIYRSSKGEWEFKIWGYIPKILPHNAKREDILNTIYRKIAEEKDFANVLGLNKDQIDVLWYEISENRSSVAINSVECLIKAILEVNGK